MKKKSATLEKAIDSEVKTTVNNTNQSHNSTVKSKKKVIKSSKPKNLGTITENILVEISPDKYFILKDGRKIKSIKELALILETLDDESFYHHVTTDRNDFATWINDVFDDEELSSEIKNITRRSDIIIRIYKKMLERLESKN